VAASVRGAVTRDGAGHVIQFVREQKRTVPESEHSRVLPLRERRSGVLRPTASPLAAPRGQSGSRPSELTLATMRYGDGRLMAHSESPAAESPAEFDQLGGRNVAVAALRMASCASSISRSAVFSVLICPLAPTAIDRATTATLSGASRRNAPSRSPSAHQRPVQLTSERLGFLGGGCASILRILDHRLDRLGGVFEASEIERHVSLHS
jgi:hypothetical protein